LIPQTFYYVYAYARLGETTDPPIFAIPSGNFGNLTAGVLARRMGLPVARFVAATNVNDIVPAYLESGVFRSRPSQQTLSSAMDVGDPSNFARLLALYGGDRGRMAADIWGYSVTDAETLSGMRALYTRYGYVADPHTAVGYLGLTRAQRNDPTALGIVLATAHPAKFAESCRAATGCAIELPERLRACLTLPKQAVPLAPTDSALRAYLLQGRGDDS
ncbi:MAG: pyridoxal-phosphate dependent enzyme, partial [Ktedonobacterales bacterium]